MIVGQTCAKILMHGVYWWTTQYIPPPTTEHNIFKKRVSFDVKCRPNDCVTAPRFCDVGWNNSSKKLAGATARCGTNRRITMFVTAAGIAHSSKDDDDVAHSSKDNDDVAHSSKDDDDVDFGVPNNVIGAGDEVGESRRVSVKQSVHHTEGASAAQICKDANDAATEMLSLVSSNTRVTRSIAKRLWGIASFLCSSPSRMAIVHGRCTVATWCTVFVMRRRETGSHDVFCWHVVRNMHGRMHARFFVNLGVGDLECSIARDHRADTRFHERVVHAHVVTSTHRSSTGQDAVYQVFAVALKRQHTRPRRSLLLQHW